METQSQGARPSNRPARVTFQTLEPPTELQEVVGFTQERLRQIMRTLADERKQYERTMAMNIQELQLQFQLRLEEKQRLIGQLSRTIDVLISNSKHMELEYGRKLADYEQEIQTYKNLLRRKYLKEIDQERQHKRQNGPRITVRKPQSAEEASPDSLKKVISQVQLNQTSKVSLYLSPQHTNCYSGGKYKESGGSFNQNEHELQTRASTLANKTSQLLSALKLRTNLSKHSAFIKRKPEIDSSIKTVNSTFVPSKPQQSHQQVVSQR